MRAYSQDLRARIMAAVEAGRPQAAVARRFGVAVATIRNYRRPREETGALAPRPRPGGTPGIGPAQYPARRAQLAADPDAPLARPCATWAAEQGYAVSVATLGRTIGRLGWTVKKS